MQFAVFRPCPPPPHENCFLHHCILTLRLLRYHDDITVAIVRWRYLSCFGTIIMVTLCLFWYPGTIKVTLVPWLPTLYCVCRPTMDTFRLLWHDYVDIAVVWYHRHVSLTMGLFSRSIKNRCIYYNFIMDFHDYHFDLSWFAHWLETLHHNSHLVCNKTPRSRVVVGHVSFGTLELELWIGLKRIVNWKVEVDRNSEADLIWSLGMNIDRVHSLDNISEPITYVT